MIQFDRYRVFTWDEFTRLWCDDHYDEVGEELGVWSESASPVSVAEIVALCAAHELAEHESPHDAFARRQRERLIRATSDSDGHPPSEAILDGHPPSK